MVVTRSAANRKTPVPKSPTRWRPPSNADPSLPTGKATLRFFVLALALMIPFWVLGWLTGFQILPGLPVSALGAVCPGVAALLCAYWDNGRAGATKLLGRVFDAGRIAAWGWYAPVLLTMPIVMALSFVVQRLAGAAVPLPRVALVSTLILTVMFFAAAMGEELGWSGYAIDPLQARWGALRASLVLGIFWAAYHYVGLAQAHRSVAWMAWWTLGTIAARVVIVWLYNHTGRSVFAAALFHAMINVTWQQFPVGGSYYDPRVTGSILAAVAMIATIVGGGVAARSGSRLGA